MYNKLSETEFFNKANKMFNFEKAIAKVDLNDYVVPEDLYMGRIDVFKGYKVPLTQEIHKYIKEKRIIPVIFSDASNSTKVLPNLHTECKFPNSIFNMVTIGNSGKPCVLVDLSYKAKYSKDQMDKPIYLDIADLHLFYMCMAGYINLKLVEDPNLSQKPAFYSLISDTYSLILSKIIDNMFPIASSSNTNHNKLYFLCSCFALENFFKLPKEEAIKYALKTTGIDDRNSILTESIYVNDPTLCIGRADMVNEYPIDRFCDIICKEYTFIDKKHFNSSTLMLKFSDRLTKSAWFALEHLGSFINMIVMSKGGIGIYNDSMIKRYLEIKSKDPLKELASLI